MTAIKFFIDKGKISYDNSCSPIGPYNQIQLDEDNSGDISKGELIKAGFNQKQADDFMLVFGSNSEKISFSAAITAFEAMDGWDKVDDDTFGEYSLDELSEKAKAKRTEIEKKKADEAKAAKEEADKKAEAERQRKLKEEATNSKSSGSSSGTNSSNSTTVSKANGISHTGTDYSYTVKSGNTYDTIAEAIYNELYKDDARVSKADIKEALIKYGQANGHGPKGKDWPWLYKDNKNGQANVINLNEALKSLGETKQPKAFTADPATETTTETTTTDNSADKSSDKKEVEKKDEKSTNLLSGLFGGLFGGKNSNILQMIAIAMMGIGGAGMLGLFGDNQQIQNPYQPQPYAANNGGLFNGLFG